MKRTLVLLAVLVCLLLLCAGSALADDEIEISMANAHCGEDLLFRGYINQEIIGLNEGEPVHISMRDVFDMFPEHSGIYGLLYATEPVTLTANGAEGQQAAGSGVVEFAFPDATECTLTGTGTVYAYFLPVPYMRLSADASLVHEHFDTAYLTETAVGHQHMFILADPHIFVYQDLIPYGGTVYKWSSGVGPLPEKYSQYACSGDNPSPLPFLYDSPVLVQCDGITLEAFQTDICQPFHY
ncbi:MAG: hypothetical protein IJS53_04205 [Clostridia bacterium]|nr:hypothetical protein [Clostridia bacterium]